MGNRHQRPGLNRPFTARKVGNQIETIYELWDKEEAYLLNTYDSVSAALTVVSETVSTYGEGAVETWTLLRSTLAGEMTEMVAEGKDLAGLPIGKHKPEYTVSD